MTDGGANVGWSWAMGTQVMWRTLVAFLTICISLPALAAKEAPSTAVPKQSVTIQVQGVPPSSPNQPIYVIDKTPEKTMWERIVDDPDSSIVALFTVVLGAVAVYQAGLLRRQDAKLSESLKATQKANELAKDSSERQLRAYLSADAGNPNNVPGAFHYSIVDQIYNAKGYRKLRIASKVILTNRGQTPAYDVRFRVTLRIFDPNEDRLKSDDILKIDDDLPGETRRFVGTINGGANYTGEYYVDKDICFDDVTGFSRNSESMVAGIEREFDWSMKNIEELKSKWLMVVFTARYSDAFRNDRVVVITETCPSGSISVSHSGSISDFRPYPEGMIST